MKTNKIFAVHLLNDYSGSPLVFKQALEALSKQNQIHLFTATPAGSGFLSDIDGITRTAIFYKWHPKKIITLFLFLYSQWQLFWQIRKHVSKGDTVYINTLLPFGAALAAASKKCKVVYHIHEVSIKPALLKRFLVAVAEKTVSKVLFVSNYVASQFNFKKPVTVTIHNALPDSFIEKVNQIDHLNISAPFNVLMLCSLKAYKGVYEFVKIARQLPKVNFNLVLNTSLEEVEAFKAEVNPPENCFLFSTQMNTVPFYEKAHLVMNLSRPNEWIETFGMTILEAMYCGRPVIVPTIGGVMELVDNGIQGYHFNSNEIDKIVACINSITTDFILYKKLSEAAIEKANTFTQEAFKQQLNAAFMEGIVVGSHLNKMENISVQRKALLS